MIGAALAMRQPASRLEQILSQRAGVRLMQFGYDQLGVGRQVTVSSDLIYDVLRTHEPDHILLQATRADAGSVLLDVRRLSDMLSRIRGRIMHKRLEQISPLAVPVMLEIGKESVAREANEMLLSEAELIAEAMGTR